MKNIYPKIHGGEAIVHSTKELLIMQSNGKFLTSEQKKHVIQYAEETRKKNKNQKSR